MTSEVFNYLCNKLGDPLLAEKERWRSIKYIHVYGSYEPMDDFQKMLHNNEIMYVEKPVPGFIYMSTPLNEYSHITSDNYTISFIEIDQITELTFVGQEEYEIGKRVINIMDIYNHFTDSNEKLPVSFIDPKFVKNPDGTYNIIYGQTRNLKPSEVEITYFDRWGNPMDSKPTKPGKYRVNIKALGNYTGNFFGTLVAG